MAVEQFANEAETTLSAAIETVDGTSISVTSASGFPDSAQYRIRIDDEIMLVTAGAGTTTWTVTRGVEDTSGATHENGATVTHVLTAAALLNINPNQLPSGAATDGQVLTADGAGAAAWEDSAGGGYTEGAQVYHSANQSIPNGVPAVLAFDSEQRDSDSIHDTVTNNSRLTCKTAGTYLIIAQVPFAYSGAANKRRLVFIRLNGATDIGRAEEVGTGGNPCPVAVACYQLAVNDYVEARAYQDTGGALDVLGGSLGEAAFSMQRIG